MQHSKYIEAEVQLRATSSGGLHKPLRAGGVYSSKHGVLYGIGICVTRRFQKSVGPSVCNANKNV